MMKVLMWWINKIIQSKNIIKAISFTNGVGRGKPNEKDIEKENKYINVLKY